LSEPRATSLDATTQMVVALIQARRPAIIDPRGVETMVAFAAITARGIPAVPVVLAVRRLGRFPVEQRPTWRVRTVAGVVTDGRLGATVRIGRGATWRSRHTVRLPWSDRADFRSGRVGGSAARRGGRKNCSAPQERLAWRARRVCGHGDRPSAPESRRAPPQEQP
jgi:hypothetical protein